MCVVYQVERGGSKLIHYGHATEIRLRAERRATDLATNVAFSDRDLDVPNGTKTV
jgi:hypothetical protein